jgi:hypothetical protein
MKKNRIIIFLGSMLFLASCSYQANNSIEQKDVNEGSKWVYGVHPDSSAAQLKNVYTPLPENEARAAKIKEKLYGSVSVDTTSI